ncbi:MAG: cytochrome c maturation protein CcmE [Pseudomonadota bacterium]
MSRKQIRLVWIGTIGAVLALAVGLTLFALRSEISFALNPTEIKQRQIKPGERVRLFGLVEEGSVVRGEGLNVSFSLTDGETNMKVRFNNILPDLFREGQGIITEGEVSPGGEFLADTVLAKHDENYVPKELAETLKKQGVWQGEEEGVKQ